MNFKHILAVALFALALPSTASSPAVKPFEPQSLEQIVESHRGKPFLLLVWSMDCEFCQASLDNIAKARAAHPGLDVVTVTTDPVTDRVLSSQVRKRLSSIALLDDAWSFGAESPERLRFTLDPKWRGEKPRSYWYDANGKRTAYSGLIKPEKLDGWWRAVGQ